MDKHYGYIVLLHRRLYDFLNKTGNYAAYQSVYVVRSLGIYAWTYRKCSTSMRPRVAAMIRENITVDERDFLRSDACKTSMRLFYQKLLGSPLERTYATVAYSFISAAKILERTLRVNVIKPVTKRLKAA